MSIWWYFHRDENDLILASDSDFDERPVDANYDQGNPHTPWYQTNEHFDEDHIHVYAPTYQSAYKKALSLLDKG